MNEKGVLFIEQEDRIETYTDLVTNLIRQSARLTTQNWSILVNLTGHEINYITDKENILIPVSGSVLRCTPEEKIINYIGGVKLVTRQFNFTAVPPPIIGQLWYIVPFKNLLKSSRRDFIVPLPKRKDGKIIGCNGFFNLTDKKSL